MQNYLKFHGLFASYVNVMRGLRKWKYFTSSGFSTGRFNGDFPSSFSKVLIQWDNASVNPPSSVPVDMVIQMGTLQTPACSGWRWGKEGGGRGDNGPFSGSSYANIIFFLLYNATTIVNITTCFLNLLGFKKWIRLVLLDGIFSGLG